MIENYFNYFTEAEEHFQKARGTGLFLLSPLDWALLESWKNQEIPIEAVLRGIDAAFEKWRARRSTARVQMVNSLAYCTQAVMSEAQAMSGSAPARREPTPPFSRDELSDYLSRNARVLEDRGQSASAAALDELARDVENQYADLEALDQRLTVLEEKLVAGLRASASEEALLAARRDLESQLRPYRSKMTAEQIAMLERQFLDRRLLEGAGLPRLSLFYL